MWSLIEINDTLQITTEQWFPEELNYYIHKSNPINLESIKDKIFEFQDKKNIRFYQIPPVRNFLVENINWKWIYWGLIHIIELNHDYINHITSGKYKIIHINSPEEMKKSFDLIDGNLETNFLN